MNRNRQQDSSTHRPGISWGNTLYFKSLEEVVAREGSIRFISRDGLGGPGTAGDVSVMSER